MRLRLPAIESVPGGSAFAALSRRVRTLIVAGVIFLVLFIVALLMPVPYVILSPGPTYNTLGVDDYGNKIVTILGAKTQRSDGHLNMTTVNVSTDSVSAFDALVAWLEHDEVVVPSSAVNPPGQSQDQVNRTNEAEFSQSQDSATAAALCQLGYPKAYGIYAIVDKAPAAGLLEIGDQLLSLNGTRVSNGTQLRALLAKDKPGQTVTVGVRRAGKVMSVPVKLGANPDDKTRGFLGIEDDDTCLAPFSVKIGLNQEVGGPSAGLMFALGIIDQVGKQDLTGGKFIAGTGEISNTGQVSAIGGIQLKMIAARDKGATIFLAPKSNCSDVRGNIPSGLRVISVSTLREAVNDLLGIQHGANPPGC